jgi:hypothetical protein
MNTSTLISIIVTAGITLYVLVKEVLAPMTRKFVDQKEPKDNQEQYGRRIAMIETRCHERTTRTDSDTRAILEKLEVQNTAIHLLSTTWQSSRTS